MRTIHATALAAAVALALIPAAGCARTSESPGISVAGDTRVDLVSVTAPRLAIPALDVTAGLAKTPAAASAKAAAPRQAAPAVRRAAPAGVLATVTVRAGSVVRKGEVLARFDDALLVLGVADAEAALRRARSVPGILDSTADTARDTRATLRDQRAELVGKQADLETQLAQVRAAIPQLRSGIAALRTALSHDAAALAAAQAKLSALPPGPARDALARQVSGLKGKIAAEQTQLAALTGRLAKLTAALPMLEQGLAQIRQGRGQIGLGLARLNDAIDQLNSQKVVAEARIALPESALDAAKAALEQAALPAPCDGVVVSAMHAGEVAMVGAPVVVIRPAGDTLVDAYLTAEQVQDVMVGSAAEISLDSVSGVSRGRVTSIAGSEQFPPSSYPTRIVHLSRVVRVTVSVPETLPLGVPADVLIRPPS